MAIKISGNTVIDDSQNITATGTATVGGTITSNAQSGSLLVNSYSGNVTVDIKASGDTTFAGTITADGGYALSQLTELT